MHVATSHHRVTAVTQVTNRRHPGRQLTTQPIGDDRVQLFVAEPGGEVANRDQISAAMRERVQRGVDVVKVMASGGMFTPGTDVMGTQFSADKMRWMVELAHEAGLPITAHAHARPAVEQSVDAGG